MHGKLKLVPRRWWTRAGPSLSPGAAAPSSLGEVPISRLHRPSGRTTGRARSSRSLRRLRSGVDSGRRHSPPGPRSKPPVPPRHRSALERGTRPVVPDTVSVAATASPADVASGRPSRQTHPAHRNSLAHPLQRGPTPPPQPLPHRLGADRRLSPWAVGLFGRDVQSPSLGRGTVHTPSPPSSEDFRCRGSSGGPPRSSPPDPTSSMTRFT